ncbi:SRPBCC domain-containing protein [Streptomyces sp. NPDC002845]
MEHEVFVPVPVERLREALADPARVARAVPGLQQDAGTPPVAGRLKVRVGGHTITYRGALHVSARDDGSYAVEGEATEARGSGAVKLALGVRLVPVDGGGGGRDGGGGGTTVAFGGTATADGRVADLPADAVAGAVGRLLNRFVENFAEGLGEPEGSAEPEPEPEAKAKAETDAKAKAGSETGAVDEPEESDEPSTSVFGAEVPPPSLDMAAEDAFAAEGEVEGEPPAEAAHARRTMIGRSAEEVDHAPPRGRYAPVPASEPAVPNAALRWAAPAAALAVASAILLGRALRRRR